MYIITPTYLLLTHEGLRDLHVLLVRRLQGLPRRLLNHLLVVGKIKSVRKASKPCLRVDAYTYTDGYTNSHTLTRSMSASVIWKGLKRPVLRSRTTAGQVATQAEGGALSGCP